MKWLVPLVFASVLAHAAHAQQLPYFSAMKAGREAFSSSQFPAAENHFRLAVRDAETVSQKARALYSLAVVLQRQNRLDEAMARVKQALTHVPDDPQSLAFVKELGKRSAAAAAKSPAGGPVPPKQTVPAAPKLADALSLRVAFEAKDGNRVQQENLTRFIASKGAVTNIDMRYNVGPIPARKAELTANGYRLTIKVDLAISEIRGANGWKTSEGTRTVSKDIVLELLKPNGYAAAGTAIILSDTLSYRTDLAGLFQVDVDVTGIKPHVSIIKMEPLL